MTDLEKRTEAVLLNAERAIQEAESLKATIRRIEDKIVCPHCHQPYSWLVKVEKADDRTCIRRRRECGTCRERFTTEERVVA